MKTVPTNSTKQEVKAPVETGKEVKKKFEEVEDTFEDLEFEEDNSTGGYDQVFFVKAKTKDMAYFEFSKKIGDKIHKDQRTTIQTIDGKVTKIELGSYTYENKEIKTIKIYISKEINNKSNLFILGLNYTQTTRSIINALLGCNKPIEKINLSLYKNSSGFTSVKMSINGKKSDWKYTIEEMRKHIETITNKKGEFVSNDYSDLDELFETQLQNHLNILFPEQEHIKFTDEPSEPDDEATFGEKDDAEGFFEINDTDDK